MAIKEPKFAEHQQPRDQKNQWLINPTIITVVSVMNSLNHRFQDVIDDAV